jgi:hypothetical protein
MAVNLAKFQAGAQPKDLTRAISKKRLVSVV